MTVVAGLFLLYFSSVKNYSVSGKSTLKLEITTEEEDLSINPAITDLPIETGPFTRLQSRKSTRTIYNKP
jgi:hypothetical protein